MDDQKKSYFEIFDRPWEKISNYKSSSRVRKKKIRDTCDRGDWLNIVGIWLPILCHNSRGPFIYDIYLESIVDLG